MEYILLFYSYLFRFPSRRLRLHPSCFCNCAEFMELLNLFYSCVDVIGIWNQWIEQQNTHEVNAQVDEGEEDA